MKTRRILYLSAGIFNCVIGGLGALFGLLMFLLKGVLKNIYESSQEIIDSFVDALVKSDSSYDYVKEYNNEQVLGLVAKLINIVGLIFVILGLVWVTFGIFNIILRRRHDGVFENRKWLKILFTVGTWALLWLNIANIATTVALFMKIKDNENRHKLYVSKG